MFIAISDFFFFFNRFWLQEPKKQPKAQFLRRQQMEWIMPHVSCASIWLLREKPEHFHFFNLFKTAHLSNMHFIYAILHFRGDQYIEHQKFIADVFVYCILIMWCNTVHYVGNWPHFLNQGWWLRMGGPNDRWVLKDVGTRSGGENNLLFWRRFLLFALEACVAVEYFNCVSLVFAKNGLA